VDINKAPREEEKDGKKIKRMIKRPFCRKGSIQDRQTERRRASTQAQKYLLQFAIFPLWTQNFPFTQKKSYNLMYV